jgi:hypothetical protein
MRPQPKSAAEVRSRARGYTLLAIETLSRVARSPKAAAAARVAASNSLLEIGWGKNLGDTADRAEIRVIIRHIVDQAASGKVIEHDDVSLTDERENGVRSALADEDESTQSVSTARPGAKTD